MRTTLIATVLLTGMVLTTAPAMGQTEPDTDRIEQRIDRRMKRIEASVTLTAAQQGHMREALAAQAGSRAAIREDMKALKAEQRELAARMREQAEAADQAIVSLLEDEQIAEYRAMREKERAFVRGWRKHGHERHRNQHGR